MTTTNHLRPLPTTSHHSQPPTLNICDYYQPATQKAKPKVSSEAKKYIKRNAHEALFRATEKRSKQGIWKSKKKKDQKPRPMTNKQRAAWAKAHYLENHGHNHNQQQPKPTLTPTQQSEQIKWTPPPIMGHHQQHHQQDYSITITPPTVHSLDKYFNDMSADEKMINKLFDTSSYV